MSSSLTLYRLQQVDSRLDQISSRQSAIRAALEDNAELKAARDPLEQAQAAIRDKENSLKQAELDSQSQRIKLEQAEASLYNGNIRNPKELKDLERDVTSLKHRLRELEDIQLEYMLEMERLRENTQKLETGYNLVHGRVISQNASLQTEQDDLQKERERFNAQREATVSGIDASALSLYESLRTKHRGVAVATVSDSACEACGASMPPGIAQSARISSQLVRCPMCGRILYSN